MRIIGCCYSNANAVSANGTPYIVGGAQNAEALFRQPQSGAQQTGRQAYQQASNAFQQDAAASTPEGNMPLALQPAPESDKGVQGRMLTFVSPGGKAALSSTAHTGSAPTSGRHSMLHLPDLLTLLTI